MGGVVARVVLLLQQLKALGIYPSGSAGADGERRLIFGPYSGTIKAAGVRLPARPMGWESGASGMGPLSFYALTLLSRTILAAASGPSAAASISFAMFSKNWLSSAVVISSKSSLPFVRGWPPLPYAYIVTHTYAIRNITQVCSMLQSKILCILHTCARTYSGLY